MAKGVITVVGLGPGGAGHLSLETLELLQGGSQVILRTAVHPTVAELQKRGIEFTACDKFYEQEESFDAVYDHVVETLFAAAQNGDVVYAVPGSPLVAERTVTLLRERAQAKETKVVIKPAMSFLDLAYVKLGVDPINGLRIIDARDDEGALAASSYPLMITQVYSKLVAADLKIMLMEALEDDYEIYFLRNLGLPDEECRAIKLYELDRQPQIDHLTSVFVPQAQNNSLADGALAADKADDAEEDAEVIYADEGLDAFDIQPLTDVMGALREPGGCPWDREQTHASIRSNMIEEVYEFLEAVDKNDVAGMREELGDVLMQVVFHARMAQEAGLFDLQDVIDEVTDKLIRRHPHVFGDTEVADSGEVLRNWEAIKKQEKTDRKHILDGVYQGLPALLRAYKLQGKAAKAGFDWQNTADVWAKIEEELAETRAAAAAGDAKALENELGDVLFAVVNYARHMRVEPETALNGTNNRFTARFSHVESRVEASGRQWRDFNLEELDCFWEEAKKLERQGK